MATKAFSARWSTEVLDRLTRQSETAGTSRSQLAERYVDEGLRMEAHPGISFRSGPAGRRAALRGGPDVWELVGFLKSLDQAGPAAIEKTAELLNLSVAQVRMATRYYADYREAVDERIRSNAELAATSEAAWQREQAALA